MLKRVMLKYWPMVLLLALIVTVLYVSRYAERRKEANQDNAQPSTPAATISPDDAGNAREDTDKLKHHPDFLDTFTWPEGVETWALILTLFVIAWQSTETRDAAKGAFLNAQAVINAERPWIVMAIERSKEASNVFEITAKNKGRTPAKIVSGAIECRFIVGGDKMPYPPQYDRVTKFEGWRNIIVSEESQKIAEFSRIHMRSECKSPEMIALVEQGNATVIVYGNVTYRSLLSGTEGMDCETRWCSKFILEEGEDRFFLTRGEQGYSGHK